MENKKCLKPPTRSFLLLLTCPVTINRIGKTSGLSVVVSSFLTLPCAACAVQLVLLVSTLLKSSQNKKPISSGSCPNCRPEFSPSNESNPWFPQDTLTIYGTTFSIVPPHLSGTAPAERPEDWRYKVLNHQVWGYRKNSIKPIAGWWYTYPSEKWWISSVGMMTFPIDGKVKNGPNHQPDSHTCSDLRLCIQFQECFVMQKVYLQNKEYSLPSSNKLKMAQNLSVSLRANTPIRPHPFYAVHLGISNVRLYIQLGRSTRVFREYKFPIRVKLYIHWRSSIRV